MCLSQGLASPSPGEQTLNQIRVEHSRTNVVIGQQRSQECRIRHHPEGNEVTQRTIEAGESFSPVVSVSDDLREHWIIRRAHVGARQQ